MRRLLLLAAVVAASALAIGTASAPARPLASKCIPDRQAGVQVVNHVALVVYCGHAKLRLKTGANTAKQTTKLWTNGMCLRTAGNLTLGFGKYTAILHPIAVANSLVLVIPAADDGTFRLGVLTVQKKGQKATLADKVKVVVKGKRSRGTFSGRFPKGAKFTGSFTCK